jgi:glutamyl-tRNA synthetase
MHIGGLRTALFSYLLARKTSGKFILRIEDTDHKRFVPDAEKRLCEDLEWAGLEWDEGPGVGGEYGPYTQSLRKGIYREYAKRLLDSGAAYRCFCEREKMSGTHDEPQQPQQQYANNGCFQDCAHLPSAQSEERAVDGRERFVIRFRPVPERIQGYRDLVFGKVRRLKRTPDSSASRMGEGGDVLSDPILVKANGVPTYHFANIIDDHLMAITHVIRGTEWMASLPLHYDLYAAFGWTPPLFAHVGLLVDSSGAKLSKRSPGAFLLDLPQLRGEQGILPETLCNFLALLGWSNPRKNDLMDMSELIQAFDLKFTRGNATVTPDKLWYLQKGHVQKRVLEAQTTGNLTRLDPVIEAIEKELLSLYSPCEIFTRGLPRREYIARVLFVDSKEYSTAAKFVSRNRYLFRYDRALVPRENVNDGAKEEDVTSSTLSEVSEKKRGSPITTQKTPEEFLKDFLLEFEFKEIELGEEEEEEQQLVQRRDNINALAKSISAALNYMSWRVMIPPHIEPDEYVLGLQGMAERIGRTAQKESRVEIAGYVAGLYGEEEGVEVEDVLGWQRAWMKGVWKCLRRKLCYVLEGPGTAHVMAVLGYREVLRRMGLDFNESRGKGW